MARQALLVSWWGEVECSTTGPAPRLGVKQHHGIGIQIHYNWIRIQKFALIPIRIRAVSYDYITNYEEKKTFNIKNNLFDTKIFN